MKFKLSILIAFLFIALNGFSQSFCLQGVWKVNCGMETDQKEGGEFTCTLCSLLQSSLPKYQNQFLMRVDTTTTTITLTKYGAASGITETYINYPKEKMFQFKLEDNLYVFNIISVGNTYILKESNEWCYLLLEKLRP